MIKEILGSFLFVGSLFNLLFFVEVDLDLKASIIFLALSFVFFLDGKKDNES